MICHRSTEVSQILSQVVFKKSPYDSGVSQVSQVSQVYRAHTRTRVRTHSYLFSLCDTCDKCDNVVSKGVLVSQV